MKRSFYVLHFFFILKTHQATTSKQLQFHLTAQITLQFLLTILSNILLLIHHLISKRWMIRKALLLISLILYQSRTPIDQKKYMN